MRYPDRFRADPLVRLTRKMRSDANSGCTGRRAEKYWLEERFEKFRRGFFYSGAPENDTSEKRTVLHSDMSEKHVKKITIFQLLTVISFLGFLDTAPVRIGEVR